MNKSKKIAYIGGTSFIGHFATESAIKRGHQVAVIHRGKHRCDIAKAVDFIAERKEHSKINNFLRSWNPEVVVDTYSMTKEDADLTLLAIKGLNVPVVVLSSQDVYAQCGSLHGHPCEKIYDKIDEEAPLTVPYSYKGILKEPNGDVYDKKDVEACFYNAFNEKKITAVTVLRLPAVYGPRDYQNRFKAIIELLKVKSPEIPCKKNANWKWSHAHVKDVAHAINLACENINGYLVFNIGEVNTPTMHQRIENIASKLKKTINWINADGDLPAELMILGDFPNDVVADDSKIRKQLGYSELTTIDERENDLIDLYYKAS